MTLKPIPIPHTQRRITLGRVSVSDTPFFGTTPLFLTNHSFLWENSDESPFLGKFRKHSLLYRIQDIAVRRKVDLTNNKKCIHIQLKLA